MPAYPFRKMTTRQLRKLLQDDQDRDESFKTPPGRQLQVTQDIPPLQTQPIPACQQSESIIR